MEQLKLDSVSTVCKKVPPRPVANGYRIIHSVAFKLCKALREIIPDIPPMGYYTPPTEDEIEAYEAGEWEKPDSYFGDLLDVLGEEALWDGYELGKALDENRGWDVDAGIIEALDNAEHYRYLEHIVLMKQWVKKHELEPKYALGEKVQFESMDAKPRNSLVTGEIVSVEATTLRYTVCVPSLGHGIEKTPGNKVIGSVINEEYLHAVGLETCMPEVPSL